MKTLNVLSIDFDYFQGVTKDILTTCYPDGIDLPTPLSSVVWCSHYAHPYTAEKLESVGILEQELDYLKQILHQTLSQNTPVMICNSHVHIYDFIHEHMKQRHAKQLAVTNIDLHHDCFNDNSELDCGNWISHLKSEYHANCKIRWIHNPISLSVFGLDDLQGLPVYNSISHVLNESFDIVFLCRSDNWLAPHLDPYFQDIRDIIFQTCENIRIETDVIQPRNIMNEARKQRQIIENMLQSTHKSTERILTYETEDN